MCCSVQRKINNFFSRKGVKKYGVNTIWLLVDNLISMGIALLVGTWIARYFGPAKYGIFSFVAATIGMFQPLLSLGLQGVITREFIRKNDDQNVLVATSIGMRVIGSVFFLMAALIIINNIGSEKIYVQLALVLGVSKAIEVVFEVFQYYFRSKVEAMYGVIAKILGSIGGALLSIVFILFGLSLIWFAFSNLIASIVAALLLLMFYFRSNKMIGRGDFKINKAGALLGESWPMIFSQGFAIIYLNIDQLMIQQMLGSEQVGLYSVAVRISSIFLFIPMIIGWSFEPAIVEAHKSSDVEYKKRLLQLLYVLTIAAYVLMVFGFFAAPFLVKYLFGSAYALSTDIVKIHIISLLFLFVRVPRQLMISTESYFRFDMMANIAAGLVNILLNLFLIPRMGAIGAAWATVVSYFITFVGAGYFFKPLRPMAKMQMFSIASLGLHALWLSERKDKVLW